MKKFKTLVCMGIALILALTPISPISVTNPDSIMVVEAQAATVSKTYTVTLNDDLEGIVLDSSNDSIATVKKYSSVKYKVSEVESGTTTVTAKIGNKTYKTKVKVSVNSAGYATVTFNGNSDMKVTSSNTSVATVNVTNTTLTDKTFKITTKATGTTTLKITIDGVTTSCKIKIS